MFDPSPANIEQRTQRLTIGGLQLALLAKKTRGETVNVALNLHWGDVQSLSGKKHIASFTGNLAGDVTGTQGATTVGKINGTSLSGLTTGILKHS